MEGAEESVVGREGSHNVTPLLVLSVCVLIATYLAWRYTYFLRRGIPGPTPVPIFGNVLGWRKQGVQHALDGYVKKYGNCCGYFELMRPVILVSDPEMIKQIMVKHFDCFPNRVFVPVDNPDINKALFLSRDHQWKKIRSTLTPAFSGRKMKLMSLMINEPADRLVDNFHAACESAKNGVFECREFFGAFIMDTIAMCAFGLSVDSQKNKDDPFVQNAKRFFASLNFTSPAMILTVLIPGASRVLTWLGMGILPSDVIAFFRSIVDKAIDMRKTDKISEAKNVDFLQLIINACKDEEDADSDDDGDGDGVIGTKLKREPLTRREIMSQALAFFVAGYETTTTGLCFTTYLLATHPQEQERLIQEIDRVAPSAEHVTYENLKQLTLLDNFINESMRLYPPGVSIDRVCSRTTKIDGHTFHRGQAVSFPVWSVQRDPVNWPDPEKFDPDRFMKENQAKRHPFAWMPFGGGPRLCIGLRFAMMEIRTALVRILQEFRIEVAPETEIPPTLGKMGFLTPPNGITLRAVKRAK